MLGEKVFISKHGETIISILNVVMRIIINKKLYMCLKKIIIVTYHYNLNRLLPKIKIT